MRFFLGGDDNEAEEERFGVEEDDIDGDCVSALLDLLVLTEVASLDELPARRELRRAAGSGELYLKSSS